MRIKYFCPYWGSEHLNVQEFCAKAKESGYDGVEMSLPSDADERDAIVKTIQDHGLEYIAQNVAIEFADFSKHKERFTNRLFDLVAAKPKFINSHTGKDYFSFEQNLELIKIAAEISKESGIKIYHETHRGRFCFAAHITKQFLDKIPELPLAADFSHWVCVAESELDDQQDALQMAIQNTHHIHARIGFIEGPQISDPRLPEWEDITNKYLGWWERIIEFRKKDGLKEFSITPEFGPYPYMQRVPHTLAPVTDQWEVNVYMMEMLKKHFS